MVSATAETEDAFLGSVGFERLSTGEQVAQALREEILAGRLRPGSHLREATLARAFAVSRNTVRGAIQVLARDGLVTHRVHRGAFVTEFEAAEIEDIYATLRLLELSALDSTPAADSLLPLEEAVESLSRAVEDGDDGAFRDADAQAHRAIASLHRSPRLQKLFAEMEVEARLATVLVADVHPDPERAYEAHRRVLASLRAGELSDAREELEGELRESERLLLEGLERKLALAAD